MWFASSLRPHGWSVPPPWDPIAGDYRAADGWIRLHANATHHRAAALATLGVAADKEQVAQAVSRWDAEKLETAVVENGGCAAAMHSTAQWATHPQGQAIAAEPLLHVSATDAGPTPTWTVSRERPLQGVRVLDLTRVLAGPVATRVLAGFGADVLRIDPPWWDEPAIVPEMTLGKRCARLDLREPKGRALFERLLGQADVLVHGYRSNALARLGLAAEQRRRIRPGLVDVSLDAYGWSGPWRQRRGFDSLAQMSSGIAEAGMRRMGRDRPTSLPVQALDHATGYLLAAAVVHGLTQRLTAGLGCEARASLARTATLLIGAPVNQEPVRLAPEAPDDQADAIEATTWGLARRLKPPLTVQGTPMRWSLPAGPLGASPAAW
jgi:crotonobetainyl-CoA:carnitine CoA-transferase CaiB-like acyl-CoA transferase